MTEQVDESKRNFLYLLAGGLGGVAAAATALPFLGSMLPAADTLAASTTEFDVSTVAPGQMVVIAWRGKPVFIVHRTPEMIANLSKHDDKLKDANSEAIPEVLASWLDSDDKLLWRSIKPEYLVVIASCTHLGCIPLYKPSPGQKDWGSSVPTDWVGGWHCPCHGSFYDLSARVINGSPAPHNLHLMDYRYKTDTNIVIG
ncbi:MAG: ubiquinol-cytochrome c reductase iron-sulfur subunit [Mariprofundales bacterium]